MKDLDRLHGEVVWSRDEGGGYRTEVRVRGYLHGGGDVTALSVGPRGGTGIIYYGGVERDGSADRLRSTIRRERAVQDAVLDAINSLAQSA